VSLFDDPFVNESNRERVIAWAHFRARLVRHGAIAGLLVLGSLAIGMAGYMGFEKLSVVDAFLNASMILGGMGPVAAVATRGGKIFAGLYALYSGLVFLVVGALLLAPVVHRVLHRFHWEISDKQDQNEEK
jgi:uncharacterized membrane protein